MAVPPLFGGATAPMLRRLCSLALALTLLTGVAVPVGAAEAPTASTVETSAVEAEEYRYYWRLSKFLGVIAGLFFPSRGQGVLSFTPEGESSMLSELLITSTRSEQGDYWRYGSEMNLLTERTVRAWSSYRWRGEDKEREGEVDDEGVVDVVSGIYRLRRDPPERPRAMEIWSDGKIYPVTVVPVGVEKRKIAGTSIETLHLSVRGRDVPGAREWKGRLDLWFARDEAATPVEILIYRSGIGVHLKLAEAP